MHVLCSRTFQGFQMLHATDRTFHNISREENVQYISIYLCNSSGIILFTSNNVICKIQKNLFFIFYVE